MELLIIALLVPMFLTKVVQNGRTDRAYAEKGMVSPRHQVRLERLAKAGRPVSPKTRGPLRNYLSEIYADAMLDLADKHRSKREQRGPVVYDPAKPSLAQRFDRAVLDGIERVKQHRGWEAAKAAGRTLVAPVGEPKPDPTPDVEVAADSEPPVVAPVASGGQVVVADEVGAQEPVPANGAPTRVEPETEEPTEDLAAGLKRTIDAERARRAALSPEAAAVEEAWRAKANAAQAAEERERARRLGIPYGPVSVPAEGPNDDCPATPITSGEASRLRAELFGKCGHRAEPGERADSADYCPYPTALNSIYCAHHTARPQVDTADREPEPNQTAPTGGTMSAPTGEAVNYETTVAELEALATEQRGHVDSCAAALKAIEAAAAAINNMQESYRASSAAAATTAEHLGAKNLDGTTLAHAGTTADAMPAGVVDAMYDQLEALAAEARARLADAEVALGSTEANRDHIVATYGDAHATVAGNLSGDSSFLDSGGGTGGAAIGYSTGGGGLAETNGGPVARMGEFDESLRASRERSADRLRVAQGRNAAELASLYKGRSPGGGSQKQTEWRSV